MWGGFKRFGLLLLCNFTLPSSREFLNVCSGSCGESSGKRSILINYRSFVNFFIEGWLKSTLLYRNIHSIEFAVRLVSSYEYWFIFFRLLLVRFTFIIAYKIVIILNCIFDDKILMKLLILGRDIKVKYFPVFLMFYTAL
jgi:hypothetical protein